MKSTPFSRHLEKKLQEDFGSHCRIESTEPVFGGSINEGFLLQCSNNMRFFLKRNEHPFANDIFLKECKGLQTLESIEEVHVPKVLFHDVFSEAAYIVMEFIPTKTPALAHWEHLGRSIAQLHRQQNTAFGLEEDNFIATLPQYNTPDASWSEFYMTQRLEPLARQALDENKMSKELYERFQKFYLRLSDLLPSELPALLHGDLWSGNQLCGENEQAYLIDPAIYYGHREMDIAMTRLFGGFHDKFYSAYHEQFPLTPGWEKRTEIHQLYPLLVHTVMFGNPYPRMIAGILRKWE
jgi:fructosamine-3-kinase